MLTDSQHQERTPMDGKSGIQIIQDSKLSNCVFNLCSKLLI